MPLAADLDDEAAAAAWELGREVVCDCAIDERIMAGCSPLLERDEWPRVGRTAGKPGATEGLGAASDCDRAGCVSDCPPSASSAACSALFRL